MPRLCLIPPPSPCVAVDWDAVRTASHADLSDAIKCRGMQFRWAAARARGCRCCWQTALLAGAGKAVARQRAGRA